MSRSCWCMILIVCCLGCDAKPIEMATTAQPTIGVYFSPKGGCTQAVIQELSKAKHTVYVQAYSFTSAPIADALIAAQQRNVVVWVILDKSDVLDTHCVLSKLVNTNVPVWIDSKHPIAHNKVIIVDGRTVITGSFNFTVQAESNAENLLIIRSTVLAKSYYANWDTHYQHSTPYVPQK